MPAKPEPLKCARCGVRGLCDKYWELAEVFMAHHPDHSEVVDCTPSVYTRLELVAYGTYIRDNFGGRASRSSSESVQCQFVRVPILFHGPVARTPIVGRRSIPRTFWAYAGSWLRWTGVSGRANFAVKSKKRTLCRILPGKRRACGASTTLRIIRLRMIRPSTSSSKAAANCAWKGRRTVDRRYFAEISGFATLRPPSRNAE
jgi:hypothetical protein